MEERESRRSTSLRRKKENRAVGANPGPDNPV
jgi:hypothetical protein